MIHILERVQVIPGPVKRVWAYFATPENLNELTPPDMKFTILRRESLGRMYAGQLIEYRVEFIPGLRSRWLTEIAHVNEGHYFVDEQRIGPYRFWYHEHIFEVEGSGVRMTDRVTHEVGFGFLGELLYKLWIEKRLAAIFDHRVRKIKEIFG